VEESNKLSTKFFVIFRNPVALSCET